MEKDEVKDSVTFDNSTNNEDISIWDTKDFLREDDEPLVKALRILERRKKEIDELDEIEKLAIVARQRRLLHIEALLKLWEDVEEKDCIKKGVKKR